MNHSRSSDIATLILTAVLCTASVPTSIAAELKLVGGSAVSPVMAELIPKFEKVSGHHVVSDLDAAIGAIAARVQKGEAADIAIVSSAQINSLENAGRIVAGSRADLGKVGIALFVRKGALKPDISTVAKFKRALMDARSIGYNDPAAGAPVSLYLIALFDKLGIASQLQSKTVVFRQRSERFGAVARGDVEIGFNQVSEIIAAPEVDLVGPLPPEIQNYTLFAAGVIAGSKEPDDARAFVKYMSSEDARTIWKAKGFEAP